MKYKGRKLSGVRRKIVPIVRDEADGGNIYFIAQGVPSLDEFYKICPSPEPPVDRLPGNKTRPNFDSPVYQTEMKKWWAYRSAWIALQSLKATEELEWEKVIPSDPDTWALWTEELRECGLAESEINRVIQGIMEVNGLDEDAIEAARQSFLRGEGAQPNGQSSQTEGAKTTQSGAPA